MADETAEAEDRIGKTVDGRYKITRMMAAGSMGAVYQAERVPVGKIVAIKFLHASYANDSEFQARFDRETRVMSKLAHPNCVSVLDFGVWEDAPYLVMDFVAGKTLRAIIDQGPIEPPRALAIARQIAAGLAHAHEQGIIHRDIKPANVMITDEIGSGERVRILDFGLARLRGNVGRDATQTNMVVGTPNYMAPEQTVGGATIDARTDIYAVGVVLFEMVVGDRPFHAEDTLQLLGMHRAAPIPRLADRVRVGTDVPPGLQELVDTAMAKMPSERFQSAIELAQALDDVASGNVTVPEERDATLPRSGPVALTSGRRKVNTAAVAATMLRVDAADAAEREVRGHGRLWFGAMLLVGGIAAMAGYLIKRHRTNAPVVAQVMDARAAGAAGSAGSASGGSAAGSAVAGSATAGSATAGSAVAQAVGVDAATPDAAVDAAVDAPVDAAADAAVAVGSGSDLAGSGSGSAEPSGSAAGSGAGSGTGTDSDDIEIDPKTAEDLDPAQGSASHADDEAADAPKSPDDVEKHVTPHAAPQLAKNLHDAVLLIKAGKRELALASLRQLQKKTPSSAYIPFLLGNLYYDQRWWGVAMDEYALAIRKNAAYRSNATLNRNVIRMLSSPKTQQKATNFLRGTIGHPAHEYLRQAAAHEDNPVIRKRAAELARYIR